MDELDRYLAEPTICEALDIIQWWKNQFGRLPMLARMALDIFAIPPVSSEPKGVFSGSKRALCGDRGRMNPETLEATQSIKSWLQAGIYTQEDLTAAVNQAISHADDIEEL